jgi:isopentenyl-diphosphate delta-isomerase
MHRAPNERLRRLAAAFSDWGIPTAESLQMVYSVRAEMGLETLPIFASGGIRNGQDIAKCAALGADLVGLASPFLKRAADSAEAVVHQMEYLEAELRIAMFCSGAANITALRQPGVLIYRGESSQHVQR